MSFLQVYFAVQGTHGRLHKTHLSQHLQTDSVREESKGVRFTRNSVRTFLVKGPDFGEPVKMRVEVNNQLFDCMFILNYNL